MAQPERFRGRLGRPRRSRPRTNHGCSLPDVPGRWRRLHYRPSPRCDISPRTLGRAKRGRMATTRLARGRSREPPARAPKFLLPNALEPPQLGFEDVAPADPTLISALVTDKVSGLADG